MGKGQLFFLRTSATSGPWSECKVMGESKNIVQRGPLSLQPSRGSTHLPSRVHGTGPNPGVSSPGGHNVHQAQSTEWLRTQGFYSCVVTSYLKGERRHAWEQRSKSDDLKWQSVPQRSSKVPDVISWPQGHWMNLREEPGTAGFLRSNYSGGSWLVSFPGMLLGWEGSWHFTNISLRWDDILARAAELSERPAWWKGSISDEQAGNSVALSYCARWLLFT